MEHLSAIQDNLNQYTTTDLLALDAQLGLEDLFHLNTHVLQFGRDLEDGTFFQMPEGEIAPLTRWLQKSRDPSMAQQDRRKRALIIPRGTTKTSQVSGYCAQRMLRNPNVAIFWTSEEKKLANRVALDLGTRLTSEVVQARYGVLKGERDWTSDHFTLVTRTKSRKEPTFTTGGLDVSVQGWHFDLIICDDLQGLTNNSPEGIEKIAQYLNLLWPVLNPGGELLWVCTRWDYDDVAARILREREENPTSWEVLPVARGYLGGHAVEGDDDFFRDPVTGHSHVSVGGPTFPSVLDEETMRTLRRDPPTGMGLYHYSCQIENDPLPVEGATFNPEDFRHVKDWAPSQNLNLESDLEEFTRALDYYLAIDFASGDDEVKYGDDTALSVIGVEGLDLQKRIFVVESDGGKWKPDETVDRLFLMYDKWRPRLMGIETNAMQKTLKWYINDRMRNEGRYLPIREIKRGGRNAKSDEIRRLQPYYVAHAIWHFDSFRNGKLEEQLIRFKPGSSIHDDYPDSLAMAFQLVREGYQRHSRNAKKPGRLLRERGRRVGRW